MAEQHDPASTGAADSASPPVKLVVDPASPADESADTAMPNIGASTAATASKSSLSPHNSPPTSPPAINPGFRRQSGNSVNSASSYDFPYRGPTDPPGGRSAKNVRLPGDLGARDPRRPKSPDPASLPGDLGANDPRKPRSGTSSPAPSRHARNVSVDVITRIHEDPPRENEDDADADNDNDSERDDHWRGRGRIRPEPGTTTSGKSINVEEDSDDSERDAPRPAVDSSKPDPTKGQSKLSFQRENRQKAAAAHAARRRLVHPSTAFDSAPSGTSTPLHSDDETRSEMLAAQKLSLTMSAIHSTPSAHRVIRQIIRGDYEHFQHEAEAGRKRQRMYLVATDLSPEAEYALEWTIGTVLRDGDTLFAVYAADEESVGMAEEGGGVEIGHGAESVRDTAAIVKSLTTTFQAPQSPGPSPLSRAAIFSEHNRSSSRGGSRSGTHYSPAESERRRALEDITQRCVRLLRKTRLQVRVVVEVFHCKSPRHMITEVIDFLSPTLVIIGSRGRSAVKGVLLGSFSNYLVTKSSVPVMVARKKLRKHSKTNARHKDGLAVPYTGSGRTGRFSNVIEAPRTTGLRVKGWDEVGID